MNYHSPVWGHSGSSGFDNFIIFCVGQDIRKVMAFRCWATSEKLSFKSLIGCYNGTMEYSFIVNAEDFHKVEPWTAGQDSVLHLGRCDARDRRPAKLVYQSGREDEIGLMQSCRRETALSHQSWTYDPATGQYFICQ
jgi:hypothetical protein